METWVILYKGEPYNGITFELESQANVYKGEINFKELQVNEKDFEVTMLLTS